MRWSVQAALLVCLLTSRLVSAQTTAHESDVEAVYLFNFAKFMRVPLPPGSNFHICILGANPFGSTLEQVTAKEDIDGHPIHIVHMASPDGVRSCEILFLGETDTSRLTHDLSLLGDAPVLTVSTAPGFLDRGGMIQFVTSQNRVRFQVNLDAVSRAHIQLSSELLKVALAVTSSRAGGRDER